MLSMTACAAEVLDSYEQGEAPGGSGIPACIVTERGDYTLHHWLSNRSKYGPPLPASLLHIAHSAIVPDMGAQTVTAEPEARHLRPLHVHRCCAF